MIELKEKYPFVHDDGEVDEGLILHWAENEKGEKFYILQLETGIKYESAVDVYPCRYTYIATIEKIEEEPVENELQETEEEQN